jgi:NTE family protein
MAAFLNVQVNQHLHSDDWNRTVYIDTLGIGTVDFNLPDDRKQALFISGAVSVELYFTWYDRTMMPQN